MDITLNGNFVQTEMLKKKIIVYMHAVTLRACESDGLTRSLLVTAHFMLRLVSWKEKIKTIC